MGRRVCLLLSLACVVGGCGQEGDDWRRTGRVVLYSPHFDLVPDRYGGLNCPSQPLQLFGFETAPSLAPPGLLVRLIVPGDALQPKAFDVLPNASVRLTRRWTKRGFVDLPDAPEWSARTDGTGGTVLQVPAGIYEIDVPAGSPLGRGIIQVRLGARDSLHARVLPRASC